VASYATAAKETAWAVLRRYALSSTMTHPQAESAVRAALGADYREEEWEGVLSAVLDAENKTSVALKAIEEAERTSRNHQPASAPKTSCPTISTLLVVPALANDADSRAVEAQLVERVAELKRQNRIFGAPPTLDQMLDAPQEREIGLSEAILETDEAILEQLQQEAADGADGASDDEDDEMDIGAPQLAASQVLKLCRQLEQVGLASTKVSGSVMAAVVRKFRAELSQKTMSIARQSMLLDARGTSGGVGTSTTAGDGGRGSMSRAQ
jgi:hypothetical protein